MECAYVTEGPLTRAKVFVLPMLVAVGVCAVSRGWPLSLWPDRAPAPPLRALQIPRPRRSSSYRVTSAILS